MQKLKWNPTPLHGLIVAERSFSHDNRGFLSRVWCAETLDAAGWKKTIAQVNHTVTRRRGCVRGMHFQLPPYAEMKFVSCLRGEIFDVAVDLRANSDTFLHWHAEILSESNRRSMLIPEGFAHGFQTLDDDCELLYLHSERYHPDADRAINALDPRLAIDWPLAVAELSDRDRCHPLLAEDYSGIEIGP